MMVPLDYQLHNGDRVEVLTTRTPHGPSRDWLNFVASAGARTKIRAWFKRQNRDENITRGRELFEHELQRLEQRTLNSLTAEQLQRVATSLEFKTPDDLFAAIGYGALGPQQVVGRMKLRDESAAGAGIPRREPLVATPADGPGARHGRGRSADAPRAVLPPRAGRRDHRLHHAQPRRHRASRDLPAHPGRAGDRAAGAGRVGSGRLRRPPIRSPSSSTPGTARGCCATSAPPSPRNAPISRRPLTVTVDHSATIRITLRVFSTEQLSRIFSRIERVRGVSEVSRESARKAHTA